MMVERTGQGGGMEIGMEAEVDRNFDFFQTIVGGLLACRHGQYALLRDQTIIDFFGSAADAARAGFDRFIDKRFSIQKVDVEPVDLGFYSHVADIGAGPSA